MENEIQEKIGMWIVVDKGVKAMPLVSVMIDRFTPLSSNRMRSK